MRKKHPLSGHRHPKSNARNSLPRGIEELEQRLVLSASPFLDATTVSPQWFEAVADLAEYDVAGDGFLRDQRQQRERHGARCQPECYCEVGRE